MLITSVARVRPLEEFFEPIPAPKLLRPTKEVSIPLKKGSIFCLCDSPWNAVPKVIRYFTVEHLELNSSPKQNDTARWTIKDDSGRWYEGSYRPVDLYKGVLLISPTSPLLFEPTQHGLRFAFKFYMPSRYRVHHLAYLRQKFPESITHLLAA